MTVTCNKCGKEYEYDPYSSVCPGCGSPNQLFRSAASKYSMGMDLDTYSSKRGFSAARASHREKLQSPENPYTRRRGFRRTRPYLSIIVFALGVTLLGSYMTRTARTGQTVPTAYAAGIVAKNDVPRKPIVEYASKAFQAEFESNRGVTLRVNYTGVVQEKDASGLAAYIEDGKKCIFIDLYAYAETKDARKGGSLTGRLFLRVNGQEIDQLTAQTAMPVDLSAFSPMGLQRLTEGSASGQIFFVVEEGVTDFTLCWYDSQKNVEQRMNLYL